MKKYIGVFLIGFILALTIPINIGEAAKLYISMSILVSLASLSKILLDQLKKDASPRKWLIEISSNLLLSTFLVYVSQGLKIPLYYAAIIYFGTEFFEKTAEIRYFLLIE